LAEAGLSDDDLALLLVARSRTERLLSEREH
jgi:hypothetical protein